MPQSSHQGFSWIGKLEADGVTNVYRCPADPNRTRRTSFALNDFLTPHPFGALDLDLSRLTAIPAPSETLHFAGTRADFEGSDHFHFADGSSGSYSNAAFAAQVSADRHRVSANYLIADARVETLRWRRVRARLGQPGSRFVRPDGQDQTQS